MNVHDDGQPGDQFTFTLRSAGALFAVMTFIFSAVGLAMVPTDPGPGYGADNSGEAALPDPVVTIFYARDTGDALTFMVSTGAITDGMDLDSGMTVQLRTRDGTDHRSLLGWNEVTWRADPDIGGTFTTDRFLSFGSLLEVTVDLDRLLDNEEIAGSPLRPGSMDPWTLLVCPGTGCHPSTRSVDIEDTSAGSDTSSDAGTILPDRLDPRTG